MWINPLSILAVTDWVDYSVKVLAALAVVGGPSLVVYLTRRGNLTDRHATERTDVEKLYIDGTSRIMRHQQEEIGTLTAELATTKAKLRSSQEEVDTCNKSFTAFQLQYNRLVDLLNKSGIEVPEGKASDSQS